MVFFLFLFCLTLSVPEKLKSTIFEISIIPQTLNINNQRTTSTKSNNLDIVRKLIEYYFKKVLVKAMLTLTVLEILLFEARLILYPAQWATESERVKIKKKGYLSYFKSCFR